MLPTQTLLVVPILVLTAWCLWLRRKTWRQPWDRTVLIAVILHTLGYALCIPSAYHYIGRWLFELTGVTHLRDFLGHMAFMAASVTITYAVASRLLPDRRAVERFMLRVEYPGAAAAGAMLACLLCSSLTKDRPRVPADFFSIRPDGWLSAYLLILAAMNLYLTHVFLELLYILREDPRNKFVANAFIWSTRIWGIAFVVVAVNATGAGVSSLWVWVPLCLSSIVSVFAVGRSWRLRTVAARGALEIFNLRIPFWIGTHSRVPRKEQ
jgi:hypothetical protein